MPAPWTCSHGHSLLCFPAFLLHVLPTSGFPQQGGWLLLHPPQTQGRETERTCFRSAAAASKTSAFHPQPSFSSDPPHSYPSFRPLPRPRLPPLRTWAPAIILKVFHIHVKTPSNVLGSHFLCPQGVHVPFISPHSLLHPDLCHPLHGFSVVPHWGLWPFDLAPVLPATILAEAAQSCLPPRDPSPLLGSIPAPGRGLSSGLYQSTPASPLIRV